MPRFPRRLAFVSAAVSLAAAFVPLAIEAPSASSVPIPQVVQATGDYATSVFSDPWDFSNSADLLLDNGPAMYISNAAYGNGSVGFTISRSAYVSPLWAGYPGSLRLGRDGALASNMVKAGTFTRLHLHAYASAPTSGQFVWFTCDSPTSSCEGVMQMGLSAGWNEIDLPIANNARLLSTGKAWSGSIQGVRLAFVPHTTTRIYLDDLRLYHPSSAAVINWSGRAGAQLWAWDSASASTLSAGPHGGPVPGAVIPSGGSSASTNVGGFPPSTYFYAVSGGTSTLVGRIDNQPLPVVDQPTGTGCMDYATHVLGHPWTFTSARSLAGWGDATNLGFSSAGELTATNAGPQRNDPYILLPIGRGGIDGRSTGYHRLTITESYDGPFNLANVSGGGTMGRILWRSGGRITYAQTDDILTYSGKRTITLDMAMPASTLTEPDGSAAQRYAFASTAAVTTLRWDPNEDPGARRWHVYSVKLAADCKANASFPVVWHDARYASGSTVSVLAIAGTSVTTLASNVAEHAGSNTLTVRTSGLRAGTYSIRVDVRTPSGALGTSHVAGPLVVSH